VNWLNPPWWRDIKKSVGIGSAELYLSDLSGAPGDIGGNSEKARALLREFLYEKFPEEFQTRTQALDLNRRPVGKQKHFSISHCRIQIGVLVSFDSRTSLGLDIEEAARIKPAVAKRISLPGEVEAMPSPAHLWVAKESFFKALTESFQPQTISEISIAKWAAVEDSVWKFEAESVPTVKRGEGFVSIRDSLVYGVSLVKV
jgi:phosphopantetheinyl transferase (holo-ACP synthase)